MTKKENSNKIKRRRWLIIGIILLVVVVIWVLYANNMLPDFAWQTLTMIGAAIAAPFKLLVNWLKGSNTSKQIVEGSKEQYQEVKEEETKKREKLDKEIKEKERRIKELDKEVELVNQKLETLDEKRKRIRENTDNMTTEETAEKFDEYFN